MSEIRPNSNYVQTNLPETMEERKFTIEKSPSFQNITTIALSSIQPLFTSPSLKERVTSGE